MWCFLGYLKKSSPYFSSFNSYNLHSIQSRVVYQGKALAKGLTTKSVCQAAIQSHLVLERVRRATKKSGKKGAAINNGSKFGRYKGYTMKPLSPCLNLKVHATKDTLQEEIRNRRRQIYAQSVGCENAGNWRGSRPRRTCRRLLQPTTTRYDN